MKYTLIALLFFASCQPKERCDEELFRKEAWEANRKYSELRNDTFALKKVLEDHRSDSLYITIGTLKLPFPGRGHTILWNGDSVIIIKSK